jgi:hypothetical protein
MFSLQLLLAGAIAMMCGGYVTAFTTSQPTKSTAFVTTRPIRTVAFLSDKPAAEDKEEEKEGLDLDLGEMFDMFEAADKNQSFDDAVKKIKKGK